MKTHHLKRARRLFINDTTPRHVQRANIRKWVTSVRYLGEDWLLLRPVSRLAEPRA